MAPIERPAVEPLQAHVAGVNQPLLVRTLGYGLGTMTLALLASWVLQGRWGDPAAELQLLGQVVTLLPNGLLALLLVFWNGDRPCQPWEQTLQRGLRRLLPLLAALLLLLSFLAISDGVRLTRARGREIAAQARDVRQRLESAESRMERVPPDRWETLRQAQARLRPDLRGRDPREVLNQEITVIRERLDARAREGLEVASRRIWSDVTSTVVQLLVAMATLLAAWWQLRGGSQRRTRKRSL